MKREQQCELCHRRGNRGFKRDMFGATVCMATTACMHRYRENRMLEAPGR